MKRIKKVVLHRFSRFFYGGLINYSLKIAVTAILTELIHLWYFLAYTISLVTVILFSFFYNAHITYRVTDNKKKNFTRYVMFLTMFMVIDAALVYLTTEVIGIYYLISVSVVTIFLFFMKYLAYGKAVFVRRSNKNIAGNYYDKHNSKNPVVKYLMKNFHKVLFSMIAKTAAKSILDVGCGEGYTTSRIKRRFKRKSIEGSELETEALDKARENNPDIKFTQESIYDLKRRSASFNLIMASEVLEHLEHPSRAILEVRRVSRKYCIFSVPNEPLWRVANMARGAYLKDFGNTPGHIQHWSRRGFTKLLKKHFKKVTVKNAILWNIALCEKS